MLCCKPAIASSIELVLMGKGSSPITEVGALVFSLNSLSLNKNAFNFGKCSDGDTNGKCRLFDDTLKKPVTCSTICWAFILPHFPSVLAGKLFNSDTNWC